MLNWLTKTFSSSIGKKYLVAATGVGLILFLVVHLAGNLTLFADGDGTAFDAYAHALEANPVLPVLEVGLLAMFAFHIALAIHVTRQNKEARPTGYRIRATMGKSTPGSRSMIVTGVLLLVFIVIHLFDFRIPTWFGEPDGGTLAGMVKTRLASPVGMLVYTLGSIVLGLHLSHGVRSVFQSLGLHHPRYDTLLRNAGLGLAVLLGVGFLSFPIVFFFLWS
jgi:succinate dehydrogenase / fumarate reductase cytochrome b subunit